MKANPPPPKKTQNWFIFLYAEIVNHTNYVIIHVTVLRQYICFSYLKTKQQKHSLIAQNSKVDGHFQELPFIIHLLSVTKKTSNS